MDKNNAKSTPSKLRKDSLQGILHLSSSSNSDELTRLEKLNKLQPSDEQLYSPKRRNKSKNKPNDEEFEVSQQDQIPVEIANCTSQLNQRASDQRCQDQNQLQVCETAEKKPSFPTSLEKAGNSSSKLQGAASKEDMISMLIHCKNYQFNSSLKLTLGRASANVNLKQSTSSTDLKWIAKEILRYLREHQNDPHPITKSTICSHMVTVLNVGRPHALKTPDVSLRLDVIDILVKKKGGYRLADTERIGEG